MSADILLAQMYRHSPRPVEQSNPALQKGWRSATVKLHYFQQRSRNNFHVKLHGQQFAFYCFPANIMWTKTWYTFRTLQLMIS